MTLQVVWSAQARSQLIATLTYIAKDDPPTAALVLKRVDKSLRLLADAPDMGVPAAVSGVRTYAVPKTDHSFDYRTTRQEIRIQRWYRQRQQPLSAPSP